MRAHFRLFGVPIRVEPLFPIIALLLGYRVEPLWMVFAWVPLVFVNLLVHEMGHALMFRIAGLRSAVVLHGFGGFTVPIGGNRRQLSKPMSVAISLAGVVSQLLLIWLPVRIALNSSWGKGLYGAGVPREFFGLFPKWEPNWYVFLTYLGFMALWWAILNILPIRPLDGGHVVETLFGFENACKISIAAAILGALWCLREDWTFMAIFLGLFGFLNFRDLREGQDTGAFQVDAPDAPARSPAGGGGAGRGRGGGRRRAGHLQAVPPMPDLPSDLTPIRDAGEVEARAWNALRSGDADKAAAVLKQAIGSSPNAFLQASVALAQGHSALAVDLFQAAYIAEPDGPPNLVPATLLAQTESAGPLTAELVAAGPGGVQAAGSLQTHLHYAEQYQAAAEVGEQVFAAGPRSPAQTAFEVACSCARAGRPEEALRWVEAAVDAGFKAPGLLDGEPDLAPVRALEGWSAVRARLSA